MEEERRANRFKLKPLSPITDGKVGALPKSFKSKPTIPKVRYYIDGAWYDGSGKFISRNKPATGLRNRSQGEQRLYKWVLGKTKSGTHCPDCTSRAGKVKTIAEWKAMGKPKCKCKCRLVPV